MLTAKGRYRLERRLGEGGMGEVHAAVDQQSGRLLALKRLKLDGRDGRPELEPLFQREFHTLSRLNHPAVIEVYEYGVDDDGPYYTMELLGGQDLRSVLPLPHQRVCALLREVASALSLLHTRQLVHRDITSRNIRVLGGDRAKLLDFGALAPMGFAGPVIGTPPFVAPEALFGQPLDARADLFSLGVVLYQALTGQLPYSGGTWMEVRASWQARPVDVRELARDIPAALGVLTMSLIEPNRAARPRQAAQVLALLAELSGVRASEPPGVARSYLVLPDLVGRREELTRIRDARETARRGLGSGLLVAGAPGIGRSRVLEEAALDARVQGDVVVSASATVAGAGPFATARSLTHSLVAAAPDAVDRAIRESPAIFSVLFRDRETAPDATPVARPALRGLRELDDRRSEAIAALRALFTSVSREHTLVVTVDDLSRMDEPSAAWLATLLTEVRARRLVVVVSLADTERSQLGRAHRLVRELCDTLRLSSFDEAETTALVHTVFGDAPNVAAVAGSLFRLSQGVPRDVMALCEHLVEEGLVSYHGGTFYLPARIDVEDLPATLASKHARGMAALSPPARYLARALTLAAGRTLTLAECLALSLDGKDRTAQLALDELSLCRVVETDGFRYRLSHDGWSRALAPDPGAELSLHRALARLEAARGDSLAEAYHHLLGLEETEATRILENLRAEGDERLAVLLRTRLSPRRVARLLDMAAESAARVGASRRSLAELQYSRMMLGTYVDYASFEALRPAVVEELKYDAGHRFWKQPETAEGAVAAAFSAVQAAQAEYDAAPEDARVRSPEEAIRGLVQFAAASLAVGAQAADWELRRSLPDLLRPFACLSPAIEAILENCLSVVELGLGRYERYRSRSLTVLARLSELGVGSLPHGEEIRAAVIYGLSSAEARMSVATAYDRLGLLENHPRLRVNALDLRAHLLFQRGAWREAAECRRLAERMDLESPMGQVFGSKLPRNDAEIHALGGDVTGVTHVIRQLEQLSSTYRGWLPALHVARGEYHRLRADPRAALAEFDAALSVLGPLMTDRGSVPEWYGAVSGRIDALSELGRHEEAVAYGRQVLSLTTTWSADAEPEIRFHGILRALALAEAHVGEFEPAFERLEAAIGVRERWGSSGVLVGVLHEARARIALRAGLRETYDTSCRLACAEFRLVEDSAFFFRARRLIEAGESRGANEIPSTPMNAAVTTSAAAVTRVARRGT
ncbi:MAG TPA: protein kinase [Polyangiaceae bacterium]|nr:protein kinase [Polyangiaceae bacterium]